MQTVDISIQDRIGIITLNRPEKRNALSHELVTELKQAFDAMEQDEKVKVIVLKANGEAFSAGADLFYLQQLQKFSREENLADSNHLKELFLKIYNNSKVVVAQVQGHAIAGGCGLATVCDFVFSTPAVKFGYSEVRIGFIPAIVMVFLLRKIGETRAKELLLGGELVGADKAYEMGLINAVVVAEKLEEEVIRFAQKIVISNSGQSMKLTKAMISSVQSMPLEKALEYAASMNAEMRSHDDCKRGIEAFLNKEKIIW
jgi:methylglutaconyl-CoA hydratase